MEINGKLIRELWLVKFRSSTMVKGPDHSLAQQNIEAMTRVWAYDAEGAIDFVKKHPPKSPSGPLPYLGLLGVERLELLEAHIINQPKVEDELQPSKAAMPVPSALVGLSGERLTLAEREPVTNQEPDPEPAPTPDLQLLPPK